MEATDREEFAGLIEALATTFRVEASEALFEGYWIGMRDMPVGDVRRAVERAMRESEHMPRPVELRRGAGAMAPKDRAVIAFAAVTKAIGNHGHRRSVDFDDPVVNAVVRSTGGWERICALPAEDFAVWYRKDFERAYVAVSGAPLSAEAVAHLPGRDERENEAASFQRSLPPPAKVAVGLPESGRPALEAPRLQLVEGSDAS